MSDAERLFEAAVVRRPVPAQIRAAAALARNGDSDGLAAVAAALAHAAFVNPYAVTAVYDAFADGWLGDHPYETEEAPDISAPPPPEFWTAFWTHRSARRDGQIAPGEVTARVVALAGSLARDPRALSEHAARSHPKTAGAESRAMPPRLVLADLAAAPQGSLARDFHTVIVANGFDLEVLDREALGLAQLSPALRYLNTRILQMHDVWHLVGGYRFTALHEVAVSAFQLAQFNHGYSAMFLAVAAAGLAFDAPLAASPVLQTIAEGWRHGRATPSFMAIAWEDEWALSIDALRARHGITPFSGSLPADLFEMGRAA